MNNNPVKYKDFVKYLSSFFKDKDLAEQLSITSYTTAEDFCIQEGATPVTNNMDQAIANYGVLFRSTNHFIPCKVTNNLIKKNETGELLFKTAIDKFFQDFCQIPVQLLDYVNFDKIYKAAIESAAVRGIFIEGTKNTDSMFLLLEYRDYHLTSEMIQTLKDLKEYSELPETQVSSKQALAKIKEVITPSLLEQIRYDYTLSLKVKEEMKKLPYGYRGNSFIHLEENIELLYTIIQLAMEARIVPDSRLETLLHIRLEQVSVYG